jgi:hypothetical protein
VPNEPPGPDRGRHDRQRMTAVLDDLTARGVAHWFDLRGATGVLEDRYDDYTRAGVDRWAGEHGLDACWSGDVFGTVEVQLSGAR